MATVDVFNCMCSLLIAFTYDRVVQWASLTMSGVCIGIQAAFTNILLLRLWGKEVAPFMQLTWSFSGVGSMISPVIVAVVLSHEDSSGDSRAVDADDRQQSVLVYCYCLSAVLQVIDCLSWLSCWFFSPATPDHPSRQGLLVKSAEESAGESADQGKEAGLTGKHAKEKGKRGWKTVTLALHMVCQNLYFGIEVCMSAFLTTFAVMSDLHLTQATGAKLTSVFWAVLLIVRLASIVYLQWIKSSTNVMIGLAVSVVGAAVLAAGGDKDYTMLLSAVIIISSGLSGTYASMMSYLEGYVTISDRFAALGSLLFTLGELTFPLIIGPFIEHHPLILTYTVLVSCVSLTVFFILVMILCKHKIGPESHE